MTQTQYKLDYAKGNLYYGLAWVPTEPGGENSTVVRRENLMKISDNAWTLCTTHLRMSLLFGSMLLSH